MDPDDGDLERWESMGCEGWGPSDMKHHFEALNFMNTNKTPSILGDAFCAAAKDVIPSEQLKDANSEVGCQFDIETGQRTDAYTALLKPLLDENDNVVLRGGCDVSKILISQDNVTEGVLAKEQGALTKFELNTDGEVLLCAGAYGSPKILLKSGIGPYEDLKEAGIETVVDLPAVGQNLVDTPLCPVVMFSTGTQPPAPNGLEAHVSYFSERALADGDKVPDMEVLCFDGNDIAFRTAPTIFALPFQQTSLGSCILKSVVLTSVRAMLSMFPCTLHSVFNRSNILFVAQHNPKSTGFVKLNPKKPSEIIIDPKLLSDSRDVEDLREGMHKLYQICSNSNFHQHARWEEYPGPVYCRMPCCHHTEPHENFIRDNAVSHSHPTGTCRMGPRETGEDLENRGYNRNPELGTVVSSSLKVHKVQGLRVADASVIPNSNRGPSNVLCMAIGSRAAEIILAGRKN